jgi:hypothetical protein
MARAGAPTRDIVAGVRKSDGSRPQPRTIQRVIKKAKTHARWKGEREKGSGRPCVLNDTRKAQIVKLVFRHRGGAVVSTAFCRKKLRFLRRVGRKVIASALQDAGLAWLRRRKKRLVPKRSQRARVVYVKWLQQQSKSDLRRFAYIDGTTFYLARDATSAEDQERRRLGPFVWRLADGKDGLFRDAVGPSLYAASQGQPVKVWGFLANGHLCVKVLPADGSDGEATTHMNGVRFRKMIDDHGAGWVKECFGGRQPRGGCHLVQDHERCLWQVESLVATQSVGLNVIMAYPKHSPDLNAIENVWALLKSCLADSAPTELESRSTFLRRLQRAFAHLNAKKASELRRLCNNQLERADDVLKLKGARTKW